MVILWNQLTLHLCFFSPGIQRHPWERSGRKQHKVMKMMGGKVERVAKKVGKRVGRKEKRKSEKAEQ